MHRNDIYRKTCTLLTISSNKYDDLTPKGIAARILQDSEINF